MPCALPIRSEEHTSELQSPCNLVCRLLLEKKKRCQGGIWCSCSRFFRVRVEAFGRGRKNSPPCLKRSVTGARCNFARLMPEFLVCLICSLVASAGQSSLASPCHGNTMLRSNSPKARNAYTLPR